MTADLAILDIFLSPDRQIDRNLDGFTAVRTLDEDGLHGKVEPDLPDRSARLRDGRHRGGLGDRPDVTRAALPDNRAVTF